MECKAALQHFVLSKDKVGVFYCDNAKELVRSALSLGWRHEKSKKYTHQSNSVAEMAVRATSEGARRNLLQAGKQAFLVSIGPKLSSMHAPASISHRNGIEYSSWHLRFGSASPGKMLAFGCRVDYWVGPKSQRKNCCSFYEGAQ